MSMMKTPRAHLASGFATWLRNVIQLWAIYILLRHHYDYSFVDGHYGDCRSKDLTLRRMMVLDFGPKQPTGDPRA